MKRSQSRCILALSCWLALLLPACTAKSSPAQSSRSTADSGGAGQTGNGQVSIGLGSIGYTADDDRSESGTFDISTGKGFTLMAEDANGYRWNLYIPPGALWENQIITMTPFATIDTSQTDAKIVSGVRLEPDGLQFNKAINLTVIPPDLSSKAGLIFSFHQDGSGVNFAPTAGSRGDSIGFLWHFSAAGYSNEYKLDMEIIKNLAETRYTKAMEEAKKFLKDGSVPSPEGAPLISMFCRGTEKNPEQNEAYDWARGFLFPYEEYVTPLLEANKIMQRAGLYDLDDTEVTDTANAILRKAEVSLKQLGDQYQKDKPPDRLVAAIKAATIVNSYIEFLGGDSLLYPETAASWSSTLTNYYLRELADKHDYRAYPILLKLNRETVALGGPDILDDIISAMTFEVRIDTSFSAKWISGDKPIQTGDVVQTGVVKGIKQYATSTEGLWGDIDNLTLTTKSGTYWDDTNGTTSLAGMQDTTTMWLKNWDACVTNTFDVVLGAFFGANVSKSGTIAGTSAAISLEKYWWKGAGTGAFIFSVPIKNLDPNMGEFTAKGSGSKDGGNFTSQGMIHIVLRHTPQ
jgi:hypothetical protein